MPIQLHERLSEFSYGYGVTREFERILINLGLQATPFFPSLLHEAELGFDVGFNLVGVPLLLQFKLGQALQRFSPGPRPELDQPFWRFKIDTSEPDGQFELLLKAELDDAEVYYVAPQFHDWEVYLQAFERGRILQQSLLLSPVEIGRTLYENNVDDGVHKIVYDRHRAYLCSDPLRLNHLSWRLVGRAIRARLAQREQTLAETMEHIYDGFFDRSSIRRPGSADIVTTFDRLAFAIPSDGGGQERLRASRLERLEAQGRTREQAIALAVAAEAWSSGAQTIFVTVSSGA